MSKFSDNAASRRPYSSETKGPGLPLTGLPLHGIQHFLNDLKKFTEYSPCNIDSERRDLMITRHAFQPSILPQRALKLFSKIYPTYCQYKPIAYLSCLYVSRTFESHPPVPASLDKVEKCRIQQQLLRDRKSRVFDYEIKPNTNYSERTDYGIIHPDLGTTQPCNACKCYGYINRLKGYRAYQTVTNTVWDVKEVPYKTIETEHKTIYETRYVYVTEEFQRYHPSQGHWVEYVETKKPVETAVRVPVEKEVIKYTTERVQRIIRTQVGVPGTEVYEMERCSDCDGLGYFFSQEYLATKWRREDTWFLRENATEIIDWLRQVKLFENFTPVQNPLMVLKKRSEKQRGHSPEVLRLQNAWGEPVFITLQNSFSSASIDFGQKEPESLSNCFEQICALVTSSLQHCEANYSNERLYCAYIHLGRSPVLRFGRLKSSRG